VDGSAAKQIADNAVTAVRTRWREMHTDARMRLETQVPVDSNWGNLWDRQVADHFEIYWSICPARDDANANHYKTWYTRATQGLSARKQTREFTESSQAGQKDSLSGARTALAVPKISTDAKEDSPAKAYWKRVREAFATPRPDSGEKPIPTILLPDGRERLDALGATKRFTRQLADFRFPSVSSIAAAEFRKRVSDKSAKDVLSKYADALGKITDSTGREIFKPGNTIWFKPLAPWEYDGDLLYTDSLRVETLRDNYHLLDIQERDLSAAKQLLKKVHRAADGPPNTYYAILAMDGDRMGARVGACESPDAHWALSSALTTFAKQAVNIVEQQHAGRVVYAGGDDLLALVPLVDALNTARTIAQEFAKLIPAMPGETTSPSISAGVVFAHHQSPLDAALNAARRAEEKAKRDYGRGAICVTALKRSGERIEVGAQWNFETLPLQTILNLVNRFRDPLASKFAFEVFNEARGLAVSHDAFAARINYLVARHAPKMNSAEQAALANEIIAMARSLDQLFERELGNDPDRPRGVTEMVNWILMARFITQGGED
jgi:CRISPR-associated protein Cmr2